MKTLCLLFLLGIPASAQKLHRMTLEELKDRVMGGWAGQMIGVSFGAPTEFRYRERTIPKEELPKWTPDKVKNALNQDDLYVDMTLAKVLDDKGLDASTEDFGRMFKDAKYALWHANLAARRALRRGVSASRSGSPQYNAHADDIDFQIEADFVGLMAPGMPNASNEIARRAGRVMNHGDGLYGGLFISCMYSAAFFEKNTRAVVQAGVECLPSRSRYAQVIRDVLTWHQQHPGDWEAAWKLIEQKWNRNEPCPEGALQPFNIDAALNGAYVALGLLYGGGDFTKTIEVSTRAGQDSDCNPASAGGILGVMLGWNRIPEEWKSGIPPLSNEKFRYTDFTFNTIVDSTVKRAAALAVKNGGRREGDVVLIRRQRPKAAKLETFEHGEPKERISVTDASWSFSGEWQAQEETIRQSARHYRISSAKGAEAAISFEGNGAIVVGPFLPTCGRAEVHLDGKFDRRVDCYPDENARKAGDALWHSFSLKPGKHTLRIVVLGEPIFESKGSEIVLTELVVFR
ncbi:MAG: ADP-ribosylglycohydrolase family protein [Acidobacteria bacterium]|nr:ADP-ribosylglycohydrolase family protein [Acidobacteriota bacterium]